MMKIKSIRLTSLLLTVILLFSLVIPVASASSDPIEAFVTRLYKNVLFRDPDPSGHQFWSDSLRSGSMTGAEVANGFFFSPEFVNRGFNNDVFVDILYRTLLNREPDVSGRAFWIDYLNIGWPREDVFAGFVNSPEFEGLCNQSGIIRGLYTPPPGGIVRVFVTRLYVTALQRRPDAEGLVFWSDVLLSGRGTGASVAEGFIFSNEMSRRNLSNDAFVEILYSALMGRASDPNGKAHWVAYLDRGHSREDVFAGFVHSHEFANICHSHGINRGTYTPPPGGIIRTFVARIYREVLGREPDRAGLDAWTNILISPSGIGAGVAQILVFSNEATNRNLNNQQFVEALFRSMYGRTTDMSGTAVFVNQLNSGATRPAVFTNIVNTPEFRQYCAKMGVNPGRALDPNKPMVALTYDDGPDEITPHILNIFEKYGGVATFYVNGHNVEWGRNTILRAFNMGCEIGNHAWTHLSLTLMPRSGVYAELANTNNAIQAVTGLAPKTFRSPFGHMDSNTISVSAELGMPIILWTLNSQDGYMPHPNPPAVSNHVLHNVRDGSIVLFHDRFNSSLVFTEAIVSDLTNRGVQLVTVTELLFYKGISLAPGQTIGHSNLHP